MPMRFETVQNLTATGYSAAFGSQTRAIRVSTNVNSTFIVVGGSEASAVASANVGSVLVGTAGSDYLIVTPGQKLHVFMSGAGNFSITELSSS